ncbi:MAG: DUF2156 domain-containing protein [Deltaproteobacteria bacterium]|jgi:hypothetical protein|nr:MAG: DUF2156 domain-containing protein [Deltaproteobacteria bacterium]
MKPTIPNAFAGDLQTRVPHYPEKIAVAQNLRPLLHPLFQKLEEGVSEFTFANIYLFREQHNYRLSLAPEGTVIILGRDGEQCFFMCPFGLPDQSFLEVLFQDQQVMKCVTQSQVVPLTALGYVVTEDRDNFDYLYSREELALLTGRKFQKKRNLIKAFINNYNYEGRPLLEELLPDALQVLDAWQTDQPSAGDYRAAREALEKCEELQLCGGIYYVDGQPAAYSLGEELARGTSFVIHFEKALSRYKGIYQFVNQAFASIIPDSYITLNREQDLGNEGLRQAKHSYRPIGYVAKYRARQNPQ